MNGSITGSDTCINVPDTTIFTYQLSINKGWNTASVVSAYSSYTKQSWQIISQEPSGGKWYFHRGLFKNRNYLVK